MLLQLILTFLKIGAFTFGGGYAMISLIQNEVVFSHGWISQQDFTDILAVSQMTPGPIGINVATYTGYTALAQAGYATPFAITGALLTSLAVIFVPVILMLLVSRWLLHHHDNPVVRRVMSVLRLTVIGVIASAAAALFNTVSFGHPGYKRQFIVSIILFVVVFACSLIPRQCRLSLFGCTVTLHRPSPILLLVMSGVAGAVVYSL
ncbi:MAG: chromate transporter [bacterium P3]|nr:MAG: chromate transporter [bacterium P3]KWW38544.1 MAG: chromate transporter [bacterium F083]